MGTRLVPYIPVEWLKERACSAAVREFQDEFGQGAFVTHENGRKALASIQAWSPSWLRERLPQTISEAIEARVKLEIGKHSETQSSECEACHREMELVVEAYTVYWQWVEIEMRRMEV